MGRKKIVIKLIENPVTRRATFKQRLNGLLTKLHDLGVLCGIKISFLCTDTDNNVVCYSNNQDIVVLAKESFNNGVEKFSVKCFTPDDVRFQKFSKFHFGSLRAVFMWNVILFLKI
jgi:hypothetical protein